MHRFFKTWFNLHFLAKMCMKAREIICLLGLYHFFYVNRSNPALFVDKMTGFTRVNDQPSSNFSTLLRAPISLEHFCYYQTIALAISILSTRSPSEHSNAGSSRLLGPCQAPHLLQYEMKLNVLEETICTMRFKQKHEE